MKINKSQAVKLILSIALLALSATYLSTKVSNESLQGNAILADMHGSSYDVKLSMSYGELKADCSNYNTSDGLTVKFEGSTSDVAGVIVKNNNGKLYNVTNPYNSSNEIYMSGSSAPSESSFRAQLDKKTSSGVQRNVSYAMCN